MANPTAKPACKHLVLDAGPILSLSPLRGLAEKYYTVPQVLDELKNKRAREHFERLGLSAGVHVEVVGPDSASLAHVIQFAKKTGDYAVLSMADLSVLALTYSLDVREKEDAAKKAAETKASANSQPPTDAPAEKQEAVETPAENVQHDENVSGIPAENVQDEESVVEEPPLSEVSSSEDGDAHDPTEEVAEDVEEATDDEREREPLDVELHRIQDSDQCQDPPTASEPSAVSPPAASSPSSSATAEEQPPLYDDPSDEDDGEGEWITPSNVALHKSRALDLLPSATGSRNGKGKGRGKGKETTIPVGCMTADFAMQNVLLQMGLSLVGVEGKRIKRVQNWVLRCHACFKICRDNARKFCPSCGNPTLLRASVTISSPDAGSDTPVLQVHLKRNFQYRTRGTIYSIPAPKPGSAKTGNGEGLILREDQATWMRAKKRVDRKREREERRLLTAASRGLAPGTALMGRWMDPDWVPEIISAGASGQGRSVRSRGMDGDMPVIGFGRKNPNEKKRRK